MVDEKEEPASRTVLTRDDSKDGTRVGKLLRMDHIRLALRNGADVEMIEANTKEADGGKLPQHPIRMWSVFTQWVWDQWRMFSPYSMLVSVTRSMEKETDGDNGGRAGCKLAPTPLSPSVRHVMTRVQIVGRLCAV